MSNLPYHRPPEFELFRNESISSQNKRKIMEESAKRGHRCGGMWWTDQRKVNQVAPAEMVNPDNFDTFRYRYQVFARPPPERCEMCVSVPPPVSDEMPPLRYNVRRIAVDQEICCAPRQCSNQEAGGSTNHTNLNLTNNAKDFLNTDYNKEGFLSDSRYLNNNNSNDSANNNGENWSSMATNGSDTSTSGSNSSTQIRHTPGYGTYQIIGGRQYHHPPPSLFKGELKLPPAQEEYQAFQRRCPNFKLGRYDSTQTLNENLLSAAKSSTLIKTSLSPFRYFRNSHRNTTMNLFEPEIKHDLAWPVTNKFCE